MTTAPADISVTCDGVRLHLLDYGDPAAPAILVLPGITSPAATWDFVARPLAQAHRVLVLDHRGRGLSDRGPHLSYRLADYARDVAAIVGSLGLAASTVAGLTILGHSMGARIGARALAAHPRLAQRFILAEPPVSGPGRRSYPSSLASYLDAIAAARAELPLEAFRTFCPPWSDDHVRLRRQWLATCDEEAVRQSHRSFHDEDIFADLARLRCPTLLMTGTRSPVLAAADIAEIRAAVPGLDDVAIAAGHMLPWDNPDAFVEAVLDFAAGRMPAPVLAEAAPC